MIGRVCADDVQIDSLTSVADMTPALERLEFASNYTTTTNLATRSSVWRPCDDGRMPIDVVIDAIIALEPRTFLDIGTGMGRLPAEIARRLPHCHVEAVDQSQAMVDSAASLGVSAQRATIDALPFPDNSFDVVSATWMLYHVDDVDAALTEVRRVLSPGGRFVAATNGVAHMRSLFELAGLIPPTLTFTRENGAEVLRRHFAQVEQTDLTSWAELADSNAAQDYLRTIEPDAVVPFFSTPIRVSGAPTILVASDALS